MKNLIIEDGARLNGVGDRTNRDMLPFMYINPSLIKPREEPPAIKSEDNLISARVFYAPDNISVPAQMFGILNAIRGAEPGVSFALMQEDRLHTPIFVRVAGERFFRAVLVYDLWDSSIQIASHHLNCLNISRRSRGTVPSISSASATTLRRSLNLKNVTAQVTRIVKKICKARPVTVADFEEECFQSQQGLINSVQKTHKEVQQMVLSYIGKGSMWAASTFEDDVRMAAFEALECLVMGTPAPVMSETTLAAARKAFTRLADLREETQISKEGSPIGIIKLIGEDSFVIADPRTSQRQRVTQLPDCVVPQVATLMAMGGAVELCGVGASSNGNPALEVNMVVVVPNGTQI
jgi:hypothetical protein